MDELQIQVSLAADEVFRSLGRGFTENIYRDALCAELNARFPTASIDPEPVVPVLYRASTSDHVRHVGFVRPDVFLFVTSPPPPVSPPQHLPSLSAAPNVGGGRRSLRRDSLSHGSGDGPTLIVELKALSTPLSDAHTWQLLAYMRVMGVTRGLLINYDQRDPELHRRVATDAEEVYIQHRVARQHPSHAATTIGGSPMAALAAPHDPTVCSGLDDDAAGVPWVRARHWNVPHEPGSRPAVQVLSVCTFDDTGVQNDGEGQRSGVAVAVATAAPSSGATPRDRPAAADQGGSESSADESIGSIGGIAATHDRGLRGDGAAAERSCEETKCRRQTDSLPRLCTTATDPGRPATLAAAETKQQHPQHGSDAVPVADVCTWHHVVSAPPSRDDEGTPSPPSPSYYIYKRQRFMYIYDSGNNGPVAFRHLPATANATTITSTMPTTAEGRENETMRNAPPFTCACVEK